jgi:DNA-binding NarL/FixJ family response regulator
MLTPETSNGMPYGVLLVDDHKILRDGIKSILQRTTEFRVVAETVHTYRKTLMKKIGVTNAAGLTQVALVAGITTFGALGQKAETQEETGSP